MTKHYNVHLGLYPDEIEHALDAIERATIECGFGEDKFDEIIENALEKLNTNGDWGNIANSAIGAVFSAAEDYITENYPDEVTVTYCVNGLDSHFYINGKEM